MTGTRVTEAQYRHEASLALERATALLSGAEISSVRYAALELRFAIEALIMGRAATFREEMGERFMDTWHPRKMLGHLRDVDSLVDRPLKLSVDMGKDGEQDWKTFGEHRPITLGELDELHNSLGSFLHAPSIKQFEKDGLLKEDSARRRCGNAADAIRATLNATLSSLKIKFWAYTFDCERCKADNQVLNLRDGEQRLVACHKCEAPYQLVGEDNKMKVAGYRKPITCAHTGCGETQYFWTDQIRPTTKWGGEHLTGLKWTCSNGHNNVIVMGNRLEADVV